MPHSTPSLQIPVIDISSPSVDTARQLVNAASEYGFIFVRNTDKAGIPDTDIDGMFELSKSFFQSPVEVKETCSINSNEGGKNRGWLGMGVETLDPGKQKRGDFKEAFNIGEYVDGKADQPLPAPLIPAETQIGRFQEQCHRLCNQVLEVFAQGLEIDSAEGGSSWFSARHDRTLGPSGSILRLLYYPSVPSSASYDPETDIRAGAHSDYGSVTLLFQRPGQPGLEILTPAGEWAAVPVNPHDEARPPILVNIGDVLSYWTNGLLRSTVHRVIVPKDNKAGEDRYSIAYFCHPLDEAELVAVPSEAVKNFDGGEKELRRVGGGRLPGEEGKVLTAKEHLDRRLGATYGLGDAKA
ncbi:hypothetical protein LTS18_005104 [Coniosporium uncinatum]|uniref:Uncharacterized protein n=1 Tax=Coniosporium uncinatum TaxID=93489 RepID=A0ACC3DYB3_9PEZI|nr:hypothetical protein LTS18_005104 [Coniosporium uncinatum]